MRLDEIENPQKYGVTRSRDGTLKFKGSTCTKDCSGHQAGYNWTLGTRVVDAENHSPSFIRGNIIGMRQFRAQGGGKIGGKLSMSPEAIRKRAKRIAAKNAIAQKQSSLDIGEYNENI
jgi:hypothetical protein